MKGPRPKVKSALDSGPPVVNRQGGTSARFCGFRGPPEEIAKSRIVVVGGRTGKLVVEQLIAHSDAVVATIRNARHMASRVKLGAETVMLDLETSTGPEFAATFAGADAVVFAAGSAEGESSAIDRKGTLKTLRTAEKAGVGRYVTIASLGASTPVPAAFKATAEMKEYFAAKRAANS